MQEAQQALPIGGVFTPRLVARLHLEGFDGSLRFTTTGATRVIYFRRGEIASAASNADADRLPNILIRDGRLTEPQLEMARSRLQPGVSLGKMLIDLGFLTPSELLQGARRQVRQILAACFALTEGAYQVIAGPLPKEVTVLGLPARRLIFDALLEAGDRQTIVREMGSMESVYRPTASFQAGLASLKLDAPTEQVGQSVDGHRTLRDISSQTSLDDFTVSRVVLALEILGLVEAERASSAPPTPSTGRLIPVETPAEPERPAAPALPEPDESPIWPQRSLPVEPPAIAAVPMSAAPPASAAPAASAAQAAAAMPVASAIRVESSVPALAAVPEEDDEPLPIPPGELPAFAIPPGSTPVWRLDPETGEKSMQGPVEMTFDGRIAPPSEGPSPARRWGAIAAFAGVVLAAAAVAGIMRSRNPRTTEAPAPAHESATEQAAQAPEPLQAEPKQAEPQRDEPAEPPKADATAPIPSGAGDRPEPAQHVEVAQGTRGDADGTARVPEAVTHDQRFAAAHRLIDQGRVSEAADAFRGLLRAQGANHFTIQVLIACEPATVQKALAATRGEGDLIVVPFALQGRACYRACWGIHPSKQEALDAAPSLPAYFGEAARQPVVVSFGRLAPPG